MSATKNGNGVEREDMSTQFWW